MSPRSNAPAIPVWRRRTPGRPMPLRRAWSRRVDERRRAPRPGVGQSGSTRNGTVCPQQTESNRTYRKIINPVTSPAAVERMQPMIERWTTWFVDQVIEDGDVRLRRRSSGCRPSSRSTGWAWTSTTGAGTRAPCTRSWPTRSAARRTRTPSRWTSRGWRSRSPRRSPRAAREPRDDIISYLLGPEVDGQPDHRRRRLLDRRAADLRRRRHDGLAGQADPGPPLPAPRPAARLAEDPELLDRAVEEFLRVFSPTQALARTVTQDTEFHGCPMKEGDRVLLAWSSANRDPAQFDHPDEVDLTAGRTGTPPSAWASTAAPGRTSVGPSPAS